MNEGLGELRVPQALFYEEKISIILPCPLKWHMIEYMRNTGSMGVKSGI